MAAKKAKASAGKKKPNAADLTRRNEQAVNRRINRVLIMATKHHTTLKGELESQIALWEAAINRISDLENQVAELASHIAAAIPAPEGV